MRNHDDVVRLHPRAHHATLSLGLQVPRGEDAKTARLDGDGEGGVVGVHGGRVGGPGHPPVHPTELAAQPGMRNLGIEPHRRELTLHPCHRVGRLGHG